MSGEGKGLVLVADGIGGFGVCGRSMRWTIPRSGLPLEVEILPWGHGLGRWHADLTDRARHKEMASRLAARVVEFRRESPGAPVYLIGKSGGTGIVVWALEQLPEEAVDASVLLAPALSPGYDLGRALRALRGGMTVFYSPLDLFLLSAGTRVFGTIDRVRGDSAGLVGFRPPAGSEGLYEEKLRQVKWTPAMVRDLSLGGHFAVDWPPFLRKHVLPLLAGEGVSGGRPSA
jgi:pimeloyl-ACP methyl ester carboxylesterase